MFYLEERVLVQLDAVLHPGDVRPRHALSLAVERQLPTEDVFRLEVRRVNDPRSLFIRKV